MPTNNRSTEGHIKNGTKPTFRRKTIHNVVYHDDIAFHVNNSPVESAGPPDPSYVHGYFRITGVNMRIENQTGHGFDGVLTGVESFIS
jgi:hypothetical protein